MSQPQGSSRSNLDGRSSQERAAESPATSVNDGNDLERPQRNNKPTDRVDRLIISNEHLRDSIQTLVGQIGDFVEQLKSQNASSALLTTQSRTNKPTFESIDPNDLGNNPGPKHRTSLPDQASLPPIQSKDVGYLDPSPDKSLVISGEVTIFSDVDLFCEQLMRRAMIYNVRAMIPECFRGTASIWWTSLPDDRKNEFAAYEVEEWITELKNQFGLKPETAFNMLNELWYSKSSLHQQRLEEFLDKVRRFTTVLGCNEEHAKLFLFWRMDIDIAGEFIQHRGLSIDDLRLKFANLYEAIKRKWGKTVNTSNYNGIPVRQLGEITWKTNQVAVIKDPHRHRRSHLT